MNRRKFGTLGLAAAMGYMAAGQGLFAQSAATKLKPKLSVMLWTLGRQQPPDVSLEVAAKAGYAGCELLSDYKKWDSKTMSAFKATLQRTGIIVDSMVSGGMPIADPAKTTELVESVKASIPFAKDFGCKQFILTPNSWVVGQSIETKHQVIGDALKRISDATAADGIEVLLEPIDLLERKDSSVTSVGEGFEIVRSVNRPNIKVLYDFYHEQRGTGNLLQKLDGNLDLVGLVHVADVPKRTEPGSGEMNYPALYRKLAEVKYDRYIAMEYYPPAGDAVESLKKAKAEVEQAYANA